MFQEQIITIEKKDLKDTIHFLKAYQATIDKVFNETKKQKPYQNTLLSVLAQESVDVNKLIKKLERNL